MGGWDGGWLKVFVPYIYLFFSFLETVNGHFCISICVGLKSTYFLFLVKLYVLVTKGENNFSFPE